MADPTWRRDLPQWHNVGEVDWSEVSGLRIGKGVQGRVLTRAEDIEQSATLMFKLPAGWTFNPPAETGTLEIFIVAGSIIANGERLGVGGFIGIPGGTSGMELRSETGADIFVHWNQFAKGSCYLDGPRIFDTKSVAWEPVVADNMPHGTFFKPLRIPFFCPEGFGGVSGNLTLIASLPVYHTHDGEHHEDTWEELVTLTGDTYFPTRGSGGPGTVISNPAWFKHGPFGTQRGHIALMHSIRPLRVNVAPLPGGPEAMKRYFDTEPMMQEPNYTKRGNDVKPPG